MKWLMRLFQRECVDPEAIVERERAKSRLETVRAEGEEVAEVVARLRKLRQTNHFGSMIAKALRDER